MRERIRGAVSDVIEKFTHNLSVVSLRGVRTMRQHCKIHGNRAALMRPAGLVVGGYDCPTSGQVANTSIPSDRHYYVTMFGGGSDAQNVACGGPRADGSWYYIADSQRFGCNTRVRITNPVTGASCVAAAVDVGPNVCVEQAAGGPIIDASPLVVRALFGVDSYGWEDRKVVVADVVDPSTPLGPADNVDVSTLPYSGTTIITGVLVAAAVAVGGYVLWDMYSKGQLQRLARPRRSRR